MISSTVAALRRVREIKLRALILVVSLLLAVSALPHISRATLKTDVQKSSAPKQSKLSFRPGEILVRFRPGSASGKGQAKSILTVRNYGREIPLQVEALASAEIVEGLALARVAPENTLPAIDALISRPDVLYAEPNYIRRKLNAPNDPRYSELWNLKNPGSPSGVTGADIHAEKAWDTTTGSHSVVVGVVDEGIDVNHPDLKDNIWRNPGEIPSNGIDDDGDGFVDDVNGFDFFHNDGSVFDGSVAKPDMDAHGTHVAGTIGATGNNGVGVVGVNWQVSLMSLKILGADEESPAASSVLETVRAYGYAKMMRDLWQSTDGQKGANVRVLNNSYGGPGRSQAELDAINALDQSGILFVAAAGNDKEDNNSSANYPANYDAPNVISVAATDRFDGLASFSNYGNRSVHLGAPGVSVLSTTPNSTYSFYNGTSMASPHVAGAAALLCAAYPQLSVGRLRAALLFGGDEVPSLTGRTVTGRRLNAAGALQNAAENDVTPPSIVDFHQVSPGGRGVTMSWTAPGDDGSTGQASLYEIRFTDQATGQQFLLWTHTPKSPGSPESAVVNVPFRHVSGTIQLGAIDNAGNVGTATTPVTVSDDDANPYTVTESQATPLSTGGMPMRATYDDVIYAYGLPFKFPLFDGYAQSISISSNGAIYFAPSGPSQDPIMVSENLAGYKMVAGLWDDLDLSTSKRADADIYVVTPSPDRIIFRWQGVTFDTPLAPGITRGTQPVNFEVELRSDGTIINRYGEGNTRVFPVVGISGGEPDAYISTSHTSEFTFKDLTNAPDVKFTLRKPPVLGHLVIDASQATPNPVLLGEEQRFAYTIANDGAGIASGVIFSVTLPTETTFVSCSSTIGTCAGPGSGAGGQVNATIGSMAPGSSGAITIIVKATTYNFYGYTVLATASTSTSERDRSSGTVSTFAQVVQPNPAPLTGITAIGTGFAQSYAVKNGGGAALAWGANDVSQLGDGTRTDRLIPVPVSGLTGVVAIQGGGAHGIALQANGKVWTWGDNSYGQLGDGSTVSRKVPAQVASLSNIFAIDAGDSFNLALRSDGTVWAWGINNKGQLGDGTTVTRTQPVQVHGMSNIKAIAAGVDLSLAVDSGGTVWAWGNNGAGALGDGTTVDRLIPVKTAGLANVIAVSAGGLNFGNFDGSTSSASFSLALKSDGTVWSWGDSHFGNLGDGGFGGRFTPAQISGLNGITAISAGREHGVALKSDGTVWCWGYNSMGLLGIGSSEVGPKTPVKVLWLRNIKAIAAGGEHTIALSQDGRVFGWGNGFNGQLGTGLSGGSRNYPLDVSQQAPDPAPLGVLSTPTFSPDGGTFHGSQNVSVLSASATTQIQLVSAGGLHALALTDDGVLWGWGSSSFGQLGIKPNDLTPLMATPNPIAIGGVTNISKIAAGSSHNVILKSDGTVWTWGSNSSGELGLGVDDYYRWVPAQVPGLTGVTAVYAGPGNSYALKSDGTVWFWGSRQPNFTHVKTPVQVSGISNVTAFAVGGNHTLALRSDGTVWAWGANEYGQLGNGNNINSDTPVQVTGLSGITGISAGGSNSAAIRSDGTVFIWGNNQYWQLATGDFDSNVHSTPVPVSGLSGVTSVSIGSAVVALKSDGTVWAWGQNYHGELGDGTTMYRPTPIQIPGLAGITAISGGGSFTMALGADHRLWIWGRNDYGQFGDGTLETWTVPYNMDRLTGGIAIHYTTDGSDPTENDAVVAAGGTLLVDHGLTLKARAFKAGWSPSAVKSATFTITGSNPIDEASTFVRQQYLDFLSREPDAGGWAYWTGEITKCGSDEQCIHDRRVGVADAFFFEPEFQESGAYIYRVYRAALGRQPTFAQFNGDRGLVVGGPGLDQSKTDYVLAVVKRDEFLSLYPRSQTAAQFVTALLSRIKSTDNVDLSAKLETLMALYDGSDNGRAAILRQVADDSSFIDAEYNTCFVLMEYFGYLRRDPDQEGYNFWLGQVNRFPLRSIYIQHAMVCSFITSFEYQLRFGQTITHSNRECPQ